MTTQYLDDVSHHQIPNLQAISMMALHIVKGRNPVPVLIISPPVLALYATSNHVCGMGEVSE